MIAEQAFFRALRDRPHALVMGVLNVTPDSFSDGGRYAGPEESVAAARRMADDGAAIIDVGGESTRPGADPVSADDELGRIVPVVELLRGVPVSIDTRHAEIASAALDAGAAVVNDVSAGSDPEMFHLVAERGAGLVLMHMQGEPGTMQQTPHYEDVVGEVEAYLLERAARAEAAGVVRGRILIDPGIGFGKTLAHNMALLRALPRLAGHGYPVLAGLSRKAFLGAITDRAVDKRHDATTAAIALAARSGAAVLRVHDVPAALDAARIAAAWRGDS